MKWDRKKKWDRRRKEMRWDRKEWVENGDGIEIGKEKREEHKHKKPRKKAQGKELRSKKE